MLFLTIISLLIFVSVFLAVFLFLKRGSEESARRALGIEAKASKVKSPTVKLLRPFFINFVPLAKKMLGEETVRKRKKQFVLADMTDEITPEEFLAYQMFMGCILGLFQIMFTGGSISQFTLLAVLAGFYFPRYWLSDRIKMRAESMVRELPHVVDMLALSTRAGLGFSAGIDRLVRKRKATPLMEELSKMLQEIQMGATRQDALRNLANRCNAAELNQFVVVLIQASSLGVPIARVLRAQSEKMRTERYQKAERLGALATQKLVFPLIMIIMPAVLLIILGPIAITLINR